jgi:hypothetical protein
MIDVSYIKHVRSMWGLVRRGVCFEMQREGERLVWRPAKGEVVRSRSAPDMPVTRFSILRWLAWELFCDPWDREELLLTFRRYDRLAGRLVVGWPKGGTR